MHDIYHTLSEFFVNAGWTFNAVIVAVVLYFLRKFRNEIREEYESHRRMQLRIKHLHREHGLKLKMEEDEDDEVPDTQVPGHRVI